MATGETRSFPDYVDAVAVAGLVLGGLLVGVCGPLLRKRNETLRGELAALADGIAGDELADQAAAAEPADGGSEAPAAAYVNGADPAAAELADQPGG